MITATLLVFLTYVAAITTLYDVLPSISDSFNRLPKGLKWLFTLFMVILGVLCIFIGKNNTMTLMGFSCTLVGFFPRFNDDQKLQHYIAAVGIIGTGMWQVGVVYEQWWLPVIFVLGLIPLTKVKNKIFWIEILAFVIIFIGLLK